MDKEVAENSGSAPEEKVEAPVAPETAPAEEASGSAPVDETPASTETENTPKEEQKDEGSSKVVEELKTQRRKRQEAERQMEYWRGKAEASQTPPPVKTPAVPQTPVVPRLDQFETYEQYETAKDAYLVERAKHEIWQQYQQVEEKKRALAVEHAFQQRINAAIKDDPTIADLMQDATLPVSEAMIPALKESDIAPNILRWLDQNRDEARRIAVLPPFQAAREMGMIEARIKAVPAPAPPKRVSAAPDPVTPVSPSSQATVSEVDLPMEEYHKRRTQRLFGKP